MSGVSPIKLQKKNKRGNNHHPSLINFSSNDPLYQTNENILFKSLQTHKGNSKKRLIKAKNNSSINANHYPLHNHHHNHNNSNSLNKQSNNNNSTNKSTKAKIISRINDHNSHEKVNSICLDNIDLSQIEKNYKDQLLEKDQTIHQLKAEIALYKNILKTPDRNKSNHRSSLERSEEAKLNGKVFSERVSNLLSPKGTNLFNTMNTHLQIANPTNLFKQFSLGSPIKNGKKSVNKTSIFNSFHNKKNHNNQKRNSFNKSEKNIEQNYLRNSSTKATNISVTKTKSITITTTTAPNTTATNHNNTTHTNTNTNTHSNNSNNSSILNQLKQKTENILSNYHKLNEHLLGLKK